MYNFIFKKKFEIVRIINVYKGLIKNNAIKIIALNNNKQWPPLQSAWRCPIFLFLLEVTIDLV